MSRAQELSELLRASVQNGGTLAEDACYEIIDILDSGIFPKFKIGETFFPIEYNINIKRWKVRMAVTTKSYALDIGEPLLCSENFAYRPEFCFTTYEQAQAECDRRNAERKP